MRNGLRVLALVSLAACDGKSGSPNAPPGDAAPAATTAPTPTPQPTQPPPPPGSDAAAPRPDASTCSAAPLSTTLLPLVDAIVAAMSAKGGAGTNAVSIPSAAARDAFAATVLAVLRGDATAACALPPSYRFVSVPDGADTLLVVAELDAGSAPAPSLFWGTYVARAGAAFSRVVVEAPHPLFDLHTEHEAADVFLHVRGSALLVAGSHRCANAALSGCSGTTSACDPSAAPYRASDAAHADALPFAAVHDALSTATTAPFLQLHGNAESCPAALVSDGSGAWPSSGLAAALATALEANGVTVGRCGAGYPTAGCDLCGTDNVEGRFTAGSPAACTTSGTSYGRFIHVEQQPSLRTFPDAGNGGYAPMIAAVVAAFP